MCRPPLMYPNFLHRSSHFYSSFIQFVQQLHSQLESLDISFFRPFSFSKCFQPILFVSGSTLQSFPTGPDNLPIRYIGFSVTHGRSDTDIYICIHILRFCYTTDISDILDFLWHIDVQIYIICIHILRFCYTGHIWKLLAFKNIWSWKIHLQFCVISFKLNMKGHTLDVL